MTERLSPTPFENLRGAYSSAAVSVLGLFQHLRVLREHGENILYSAKKKDEHARLLHETALNLFYYTNSETTMSAAYGPNPLSQKGGILKIDKTSEFPEDMSLAFRNNLNEPGPSNKGVFIASRAVTTLIFGRSYYWTERYGEPTLETRMSQITEPYRSPAGMSYDELSELVLTGVADRFKLDNLDGPSGRLFGSDFNHYYQTTLNARPL